MVFNRQWDATCPRVWDEWEADGTSWTIQDLHPEDDERAVQLMLTQFCPDETLCSTLGIDKDPVSLNEIGEFWRKAVSQRMSLACYQGVGDHKNLAALNICVVKCIDDEEWKHEQMETDKFSQLLKTLMYLDSKYDPFEDLGVDQYLYGLGLLVTREHRGSKLGAKVLAAREPMCHHLGIRATATLFTGVASQRLATRCGFTTNLEVALRELASIGMHYPEGDERSVKIQSKKYFNRTT